MFSYFEKALTDLTEIVAPISQPNALFRAIQDGDNNQAIMLINSGKPEYDIYYLNQDVGYGAIHVCCKFNNQTMLDEIVTRGVSIEFTDKTGNTPLHWACKHGHEDLVKYLVTQKNSNILKMNYARKKPYDVSENHKIRQWLLPLQFKAEAGAVDNTVPTDNGMNSNSGFGDTTVNTNTALDDGTNMNTNAVMNNAFNGSNAMPMNQGSGPSTIAGPPPIMSMPDATNSDPNYNPYAASASTLQHPTYARMPGLTLEQEEPVAATGMNDHSNAVRPAPAVQLTNPYALTDNPPNAAAMNTNVMNNSTAPNVKVAAPPVSLLTAQTVSAPNSNTSNASDNSSNSNGNTATPVTDANTDSSVSMCTTVSTSNTTVDAPPVVTNTATKSLVAVNSESSILSNSSSESIVSNANNNSNSNKGGSGVTGARPIPLPPSIIARSSIKTTAVTDTATQNSTSSTVGGSGMKPEGFVPPVNPVQISQSPLKTSLNTNSTNTNTAAAVPTPLLNQNQAAASNAPMHNPFAHSSISTGQQPKSTPPMRRFTSDGFHSSTNDPVLQAKYGHIKISKNVAPPPIFGAPDPSKTPQMTQGPPNPSYGGATMYHMNSAPTPISNPFQQVSGNGTIPLHNPFDTSKSTSLPTTAPPPAPMVSRTNNVVSEDVTTLSSNSNSIQ